MKTSKGNTIPILRGEAFPESYFRHPLTDRQNPGQDRSLQHFSLFNRCLWKREIAPHRLDFYLVFLVTGGEGIQTFGIKEHYIRQNMLCFVGPQVISSWQSGQEEHAGYCCTFSDDFFNLGREDKQFLAGLPFFQIGGNAVLLLSNEQLREYITLFRLMEKEYTQPHAYSEEVIRSYLHALLTKALGEYQQLTCEPDQPNPQALRLLKAFTALYLRDFAVLPEGKPVNLKKVREYAEELNVTQNHLNDTIRTLTGQSAGSLIRNQLVKQATMCLKHSTKTISEIAWQLGFEDPSYFSRFYKARTGHSPSDFR